LEEEGWSSGLAFKEFPSPSLEEHSCSVIELSLQPGWDVNSASR